MFCDLHDASRIAQHNTDTAIAIGNSLIEKGHFVFVPHVSHYIHTHWSCKRDYGEWWYEEDLTFLYRWANALYYISPSKGTDLELEIAKKLGLRIFRSLEEVPEVPSKPLLKMVKK
jgi:hypothetical protein